MLNQKACTYLLLLFTIEALLSCNEKNGKTMPSLRDSIIKAHLSEIDSLDFYDTTDINYKLIKAYYHNDSFFFRNFEKNVYSHKIYMNQWASADTCVHLEKIKDSNSDSIYRFIYSESFSPYETNITVSKSSNTARIHMVVYHESRDSLPCEIIDEFDKTMSLKDWNEFNNSLSSADFWGLKEDNGIHGLDGSTLTIYAFIKGNNTYLHPRKSQMVSRWIPYNLPIYQSYNFLLEIVKERYKVIKKLEQAHFRKYYISKNK